MKAKFYRILTLRADGHSRRFKHLMSELHYEVSTANHDYISRDSCERFGHSTSVASYISAFVATMSSM